MSIPKKTEYVCVLHILRWGLGMLPRLVSNFQAQEIILPEPPE
jgi:hypothetical protein